MKIYFSRKFEITDTSDEDYTKVSLQDSIEKTRRALDIAYAGFDDAVETELIDSYIYEINALQLRYKYLISQADLQESAEENTLRKHSPVRALVSHVFG